MATNYHENIDHCTDIKVVSTPDKSIFHYGCLIKTKNSAFISRTWMLANKEDEILEKFVGEPEDFPASFLAVKNFYKPEDRRD